MIRILAAVMFLAVNAYVYHFFAPIEESPPRESFDSFPMELEGWACFERDTIPPEVARQLRATDTFGCNFQRVPHQPLAVCAGAAGCGGVELPRPDHGDFHHDGL